MGVDIRLPNINAPTNEGRLEQIRSYLYQFAEQLNWALTSFEEAANNGGIVVTTSNSNGTGASVVKKVSSFNELKDLIVSSADFVEAMATEIKRIYDGQGSYVAVSDFGTYKEERSALLETDTETGVTLLMTKEATIDEDNDGDADHTRIYEGCIEIGDVTIDDDYHQDGETKYGISIGQLTIKKETTNDKVTYNKSFKSSARFTSTTLDFFDEWGKRIAYIDRRSSGEEFNGSALGGKFYIQNAEITNALIIGNYYIDAGGGGLAFTWVGGGN